MEPHDQSWGQNGEHDHGHEQLEPQIEHVHPDHPAAAHEHLHGEHGSRHDHEHPHDDHDHGHGAHDHEHGSGLPGLLGQIFHSHEAHLPVEPDLDGRDEGMHTVRLSLIGLGITACIQLIIALSTGSVGLLADTIHNFSDALTAIPLWLAFAVSRRPANRQYTYGYGRAEDVAGLAIVLMIFASAAVAFWEAYQKLVHPTLIHHIFWVMGAAIVGFLGNEGVALLRINTGRRIGSAALEADGQHARIDGIVSLGVLIGAVAVLAGVPEADPIVGILITVLIVFITKDAALTMWHRLMDAVDPALVARVEDVARNTPGIDGVDELRLRWLGHRLVTEMNVLVDENETLGRAHAIAEDVRHRLFHAFPQLSEATVHLDPHGPSGTDHHAPTAHHRVT